jgi:hypothetical protein
VTGDAQAAWQLTRQGLTACDDPGSATTSQGHGQDVRPTSPGDSSSSSIYVPMTADVTAPDLSALRLPQVFAPAEAARILRSLGLTEITECALRTRAYRKQVPFHLNGRRIIFTLGDLREIAEGETRKPVPRAESAAPGPAPRPAPRCRPAHQGSEAQPDPWRARGPHGLRANLDGGDRT